MNMTPANSTPFVESIRWLEARCESVPEGWQLAYNSMLCRLMAADCPARAEITVRGPHMDDLNLTGDLDMGQVTITPASKLLDAVIIRANGAIRIKGDTTEFVADSFKVKDGATVEDLLKKLPGLSVNSKGEITAQGKRVDKVLVDGEEFFGDDPTMATKNISSKAVDKVQVFDYWSVLNLKEAI